MKRVKLVKRINFKRFIWIKNVQGCIKTLKITFAHIMAGKKKNYNISQTLKLATVKACISYNFYKAAHSA